MVALLPSTVCATAARVRLSTPPESATPISWTSPIEPNSASSSPSLASARSFSMFGFLPERRRLAAAAQNLPAAALATGAHVVAFGLGAQGAIRPPREFDAHRCTICVGDGGLMARKHAAREDLVAHAQRRGLGEAGGDDRSEPMRLRQHLHLRRH